MITVYLYTFSSVIIVSFISLIGIVTLSFNETFLRKVIFVLVSLAVGALLGDSFIHLIPEAFEKSFNPGLTSLLLVAGLLMFFVLEKFLHWHHTHGNEEECHDISDEAGARKNKGGRTLGYMILASDGLHNFIDGIIIGASYLVSIEVGIATTIAIILHEIPQEIGDFAILLHAGWSKMRALFFNFLSALFAIVGAVVALTIGGIVDNFIVWIIPLAAGSFIYIAGSDLIPELHKTRDLKRSLIQLAAIIVGISAMYALLFFE